MADENITLDLTEENDYDQTEEERLAEEEAARVAAEEEAAQKAAEEEAAKKAAEEEAVRVAAEEEVGKDEGVVVEEDKVEEVDIYAGLSSKNKRRLMAKNQREKMNN